MAEAPITIHYQHMEEWLGDRKAVLACSHAKPFAALLSLAPQLTQLVQYDIPALHKRVKKNTDAVAECHRVCEEAERTMANVRKKRLAFMREHGLAPDESPSTAGADVEAAVEARIAQACHAVTTALLAYASDALPLVAVCYDAVVHASAPDRFCPTGTFHAHHPWLARLQSEHDLPLRGVSRAGAIADAVCSTPPADEDGACGIDWGDDTANDAAVGVVQIDWSNEPAAAAGLGDDADDDALPPQDHVHLSLDFARAPDRAHLVAELQSALGFLRERQYMLSGDEHVESAGDAAQLATLVAATENVIATLSTSTDAFFVRMRDNFRARDDFADTLRRFDRTLATAQARRESHAQKASEVAAEVQAVGPQLESLRATARGVRDECLAQLALIFPDRQVMIVGDITKLIQ